LPAAERSRILLLLLLQIGLPRAICSKLGNRERERQWGREKAWREAQEAGTLMWPVNVEVGGVSANQVARACHVGGREGGVGPARVGSGREG